MIQQFTSAEMLHSYLEVQKSNGIRVGFVPTMGALHTGHISLINRAMLENDLVVCSIFVNPKQFNNSEDLKKYPRTVEADIEMLLEVGCPIVFTPTVDEVYPSEVTKTYNFGSLGEVLEGEHRPGHFNGMAIVVKRFFDIVIPDKAYFGEKDYQQLLIVKKLVEIEQIPTQIIGCPISRESSGLAMSSRNKLLTDQQAKDSAIIFNELSKLSQQEIDLKTEENIKSSINNINLFSQFEVEYLELVNRKSLLTYSLGDEKKDLHLFIAVKVGSVRLIDNLPIIA
jgi:pantoate--beta-alanine ligase